MIKSYDVARLPSLITLGYDGENNWRPIQFDCSVLLANHPNGTISLWLLPEGEAQAFPVALERDGNYVVWTPLNEEMTSERGAFQLVCTDGTDVGKSAVVLFRVDDSVVPGAEHPAAVPSWATQTIERAEAAADRAEAAADSIDTDAIEAMIEQAIEDYLEQHPIQAPVQSVNGKTGVVVLGASDVGALPANTHIPDDAVWRGEWSVSARYDVGDFVSYGGVIYRCNTGGIGIYPDEETGWDEWFDASNLGAYVKPSGGIPKTDLAQSVQTSLGKADTALQQHQSLAGYATESYVQQQIAAIPDELPAVSASDDGKVLGVVNGAWAAKADEGGSAPFVIPVTASGSGYSTTASAADIVANYDNCVMAFANATYRPDVYGLFGSNAQIVFSVTDSMSGYVKNMTVVITVYNGTVTVTEYEANAQPELPTVSSSDNGKFLRVVSGAWAAASVPSAESNSFGGGS